MTSEILQDTSNGAILDVGVILVDLNWTVLKFDDFLKHDISELMACSEVTNLALFKVKLKIFKVEINLYNFTWKSILDHIYACKNLKSVRPVIKKSNEEFLRTFCSVLVYKGVCVCGWGAALLI